MPPTYLMAHGHPLHPLNLVMGGITLGSIAGLLPPLAAVVAILYYCIEIYESETVQKLLKRNNG